MSSQHRCGTSSSSQTQSRFGLFCSSMTTMINSKTLVVLAAFWITLVAATAGYYVQSSSFLGILNPAYFCARCEFPNDTPASINLKDNLNENVRGGLYDWNARTAVIYFVTGQDVDLQTIEVLIEYPIKETILVLSSELSVKYRVKFNGDSATAPNVVSRLKKIIVNSPTYNAIEMVNFGNVKTNVTYLCNESPCSAAAIRVSKSYVWASGGSQLQELMAPIVGQNYTTFLGCERTQSLMLGQYGQGTQCEPLSGGVIAAIVVSVVIPVCCFCLALVLGLLRVCLACLK
ncbi:hypothetical protein C9374_010756 [Naegleria lovaniensis]|uniref:Uncharacterized protein n=1 Tax=Naegleria lovaniensis TaxID=51637 RepID=A0AA88GF59_NAELO|nr:uncharacterized protein C9374_010756 [Naegleria lovaniensis]KAG2374472.1 hypothetical protein C9374_010756 [Naegleria lovaniensis]